MAAGAGVGVKDPHGVVRSGIATPSHYTMSRDAQERVFINIEVQKGLAAGWRPGLAVMLYDEEIEVEGIVKFDEEHYMRNTPSFG